MIPYLFALILVLAFIFLILGLFGKIALHNQDSRTYSLFILISGLLFIFISLIIFTDGIEYKNIENKTQEYFYDNISSDIRLSNITTTTTDFSSSQKDGFTIGLGIIFLLLSLFLFYTSIFDIANLESK